MPAFLCALLLAAAPVWGYTGGPVRAELLGYEPSERRVYYQLKAYDESGDAPRVFFFDLAGSAPAVPVRAADLEQPDAFHSTPEVSKRQYRLEEHLVALPMVHSMATMTAGWDSLRIDPVWERPVYAFRVALQKDGIRGAHADTAYCSPLFRQIAAYRIPGRQEEIAVLSFIGRAYGCEPVQLPVLLVPSGKRAK